VRWWKWLGLAGIAGVTATGVVIARDERRRRAYSPDEVRDRLHARVAELAEVAEAAEVGTPAAAAPASTYPAEPTAGPHHRSAWWNFVKRLRRTRRIRHSEGNPR
jgi:hypothetical protein